MCFKVDRLQNANKLSFPCFVRVFRGLFFHVCNHSGSLKDVQCVLSAHFDGKRYWLHLISDIFRFCSLDLKVCTAM